MSEEQDDSDKTEEPSSRKLDEARQRGQVPQSKEISHWFMILGASVILAMMAPFMGKQLYDVMYPFIERPHDFIVEGGRLGDLLQDTVLHVILALLMPLLLLMVFAFLSSVLQFGIIYSTDNIQPKLERISLFKGFKRLFSMRSVVELIKGILKISIVAAVILWLIKPSFESGEKYISMSINDILLAITGETSSILFAVVGVVTMIAMIDWLYQRFSFFKSMRMSKQELKDEYRQSEGDPLVKQRLKQIRMDKARQRMMAAVPKSTAVITNPTHYAIALQYDETSMNAPKVVAKGVDSIALKIRQIAEENDVPIMENPPLARGLYASVDLDEEVPTEYYKAVAEVISFVYRLKRGKK